MSGTYYSDLHPHGYGDWANTHLRFNIKSIKATLGGFVLGLVTVYLAYVLVLLIGSITICLTSLFG